MTTRAHTCLLAVLVGAVAAGCLAAEGDPAFYAKQSTWEETVRLSREALSKQCAEEQRKREESRTTNPDLKGFTPGEFAIKQGEEPRQIKQSVAGLKSVFIRSQHRGSELIVYNAQFSGKGVKPLHVKNAKTLNQWGDKIHGGKEAVKIDGRDTKDYQLWSNTEIEVALDGKYDTFEAWIAVKENRKDSAATLFADVLSHFAPRDARAANVQRIWNLVRRDFGDFDAVSKVAIADPDGVWASDWNAGDFKNLAGRFASKCVGDWKSKAMALAKDARSADDLARARALYYKTLRGRDQQRKLESFNAEALPRAINDLAATYPNYPAAKYRDAAVEFGKTQQALRDGLIGGNDAALAKAEALTSTLREAMLANPLLDFGKLLLVKRTFKDGSARHVMGSACGLIGLNSHTNDDIPHTGWDNEIGQVTDLRGTPQYKTIYHAEGSHILRDMDLDFDGKRLMFSSISDQDRWALFELNLDQPGTAKQLTPRDLPDVDFFDSCYLPDGRIISASTAGYQGLPCENGGKPMVNLYQFDPTTSKIRQLTFEQDSDWHPSVLNDGRVLYLRWEYTDIMHYFSRRLFSMNPDGTTQMAYYGSGSMFPPGFKFARAIPGHPSRIVGVIAGHHDFPEHGRMAIVDPDLASAYPFRYRPTSKEWGKEGDTINIIPDVLPASKTGFVQEIPGYGKDVVGNVCDGIAGQAWKEGKPQFLHPYPLSEKYFLVSMKRNTDALWGIYLVDIFDNMTLIAENETAGFFQPIPLRPRTRPPLIQDRIALEKKTADVMITDIYSGPGLKNIPRGTVKSVRVLAYHYAYLGRGGHESIGVESSWDVKRVLGTTPVESDGSAHFRVPANTPVFLQPLDQDGAALQLMRTWMVGMPGERVSCVGCHEKRGETLPLHTPVASRRPASELRPWYGPSRPFAFQFEVFPVVEKYCIGCHDGKLGKDGRKSLAMNDAQTAYNNLHPYCRRPGPESDMEMFVPMEYHGSTSPLAQMLKKGHYGVSLDAEAWERLYCWIDLNVPFKGHWTPDKFRDQPQQERRRELACRFANLDVDPEAEYRATEERWNQRAPVAFVAPPEQKTPAPDSLRAENFPMSAEAAATLQKAQGKDLRRTLKVSNGLSIDFVRVPAGQFVMGSQDGYPDEQPRAVVAIQKPFWMSVCEITNAQYERFDPNHDTRYIDEHGKDHTVPGYIANHPNQPVARVSWQEGQAFCAWLSQETGSRVALPTEAQWEWAARAGTATQFYYGTKDTDFGKFANLADKAVRVFKTGWDGGSKIHTRRPYPVEMNFPLHDERFEDNWFIVDYVGQCEANAWGLKDMIGNVSEWTRSSYRPYPYKDDDGRNGGEVAEKKVARGGSWADRPKDAGASVRYAYESFQKVHNVGLRIIIEE